MALDRNDRTMAIPPDQSSMPPAARLCLRLTVPDRGVLDGGWWPCSRDPAVELPKLIADLNTHFGQLAIITRVALNLTAWDHTPHRVAIGDRIVPVGWSGTLDIDTIALITTRHDRITLLVVPPEATADSAAIALAMASLGDNSTRPLAVLAASGITASNPAAASLARHPSFSSVRSLITAAAATPLHPVP
jgi:Family of unknown function (DUF5994)